MAQTSGQGDKAANTAKAAPKAQKRKAASKTASTASRRGAGAKTASRTTERKPAPKTASARRSGGTKAASPTKRRTARKVGIVRKPNPKAAVDRTARLSEELFESVEAGQRAAIQAVRRFVDSVEEALPLRGEGSPRRQEVVESAIEMADRLVHTQYDFLRSVVHTAAKTLRAPDDKR
jgi:hypothetical protein